MTKNTDPHKKNIYPPVSTFDVIKEYWKSSKKYWYFGVLALIGISISTAIFSVIIPLYYKQFFDYINHVVTNSDADVAKLVSIITTILVFGLVGLLFSRGSFFSMIAFEGRSMIDIKQRAFDYLMRHSYSLFSNNFSGSLVQRVNRFTRSFERIFDKFVMDIFPLIIKVVGVVIVLSFIEIKLAYVLLAWICAFMAFSFIMTKIKYKYDLVASELDSKSTGALSDSVSNHNAVQLFTGNTHESERFGAINIEHMNANLFRWNFGEITNFVQVILTVAAEFFVFYFGIMYWHSGLLSVGTFVLVQAYIISINGSLWSFSRIVRDITEGVADAKEMVEIIHLKHEIKDVPGARDLVVDKGMIEFKNISFAFGAVAEKNKMVFSGLNITIKAGEKVALIGSSGAGKSTLVKLLLRLHDINGGEIVIDGQDIKGITQDSLRENVSLVPQDPALFHRTLMENIRYGKRDATDAEVIEASKLAHCDIFIQEFPLKYETFVGERGIKLSGGERQRVAIARAMLKNAPILVLDEATSSLDSHSEALIQDALHTLMKGKTTLVIAHRLSTIKKMDRIIVLGKEGVIEDGSHDELLKKENGTYAKLWNLQAGGFANKSIEEMLEG
ncbi:MAG: ABC transporter ATP-binding protein [Candidatus Pacebacteria bacterium]|nr:ABC transporter ATP-binding protein [Candidatus Paceibacterota bacterium]